MGKRTLCRGWLLLVSLVLVACSHRVQRPATPYGPEVPYSDLEDSGVELQVGGERERSGFLRAAAKVSAGSEPSAPALSAENADPSGAATGDTAGFSSGDRKVYYNGAARLRVAKIDEAQRRIQALAAASGGLVENRYAGAITLRVPVARFQKVFDQILELGEVLEKVISASDITDRYTATALRLQTAQTTRDRLITLLARAETESDKLYLIRQIQRLTEEIDRLEGTSRALESMATLSRITVQLVPRSSVTWQGSGEDAAALAWIRMLSPFRMDVARANRKLSLDTPDGMVALGEAGTWVAESADGARVWAAHLPNEPLGTAQFWMEALESRLAGEFSLAETGSTGRFRTLRLVSRDDLPYVWIVGVAVVGKRLQVLEQFYPSLAHEDRYREAVAAVLAGGGET